MAASLDLKGVATDPELLARIAADSNTIGLDGLLAEPGPRARRVRVPGEAVEGFRWPLRDNWSTVWWPQGVAVGRHRGIPIAMASWFAQTRGQRAPGSRISVVDLRSARPRFHHVLLVTPRLVDGRIEFEPVKVHAGGIVWSGDRLFVAATLGGFREFRLRDILRTPTRGILRRGSGPYDQRYLLPQAASFGPVEPDARERMRYSFISHETSSAREPERERDREDESEPESLRLVAGEFGPAEKRRLARLTLSDASAAVDEHHVPGIPNMQGAVLHDGEWFVSASRGDKRGGDLWVGPTGDLVRHELVFPPGPEDLAVWPERRQLWSLTEFPGKRWMFALDLDRWSRS